MKNLISTPSPHDATSADSKGLRALSRALRRSGLRGFTITELMLVMAIIGIMSALSFPRFYEMLRDRRVNQNALEIMNFYRMAKTRALGRGSAVMVWYSNSWQSNVAYFEMREAVVDSTPSGNALVNALPTSSCSTTNWGVNFQGPNGSRRVAFRAMGTAAANPGTYAFQGPPTLTAQSGTLAAQPYAELCFTPRGRTFIRYAAGATWFPLSSVPTVDVRNARLAAVGGGVTRQVFIPASGIPRMAL